jgi:hypothetical protein
MPKVSLCRGVAMSVVEAALLFAGGTVAAIALSFIVEGAKAE